MKLLHERWRTRASLLAADCLDGGEREATLHHLEDCAECRREHAQALAVLETMAQDPARDAELPIALEFLEARVRARVDSALRARPFRWATLAYGLGVAALLVVTLPRLLPPLITRFAGPRPTVASGASSPVALDDQSLRRMERTLAREQAVRYLSEAQDVLVTMASHPLPCPDKHGHVAMAAEAQRSRELLARRALLVELDGDDVATARPVLEDVEHVLRQVAALESCARGADVERVQREVERQRLLMKIRLMSRELSS
jgi:hypothetical protein